MLAARAARAPTAPAPATASVNSASATATCQFWPAGVLACARLISTCPSSPLLALKWRPPPILARMPACLTSLCLSALPPSPVGLQWRRRQSWWPWRRAGASCRRGSPRCRRGTCAPAGARPLPLWSAAGTRWVGGWGSRGAASRGAGEAASQPASRLPMAGHEEWQQGLGVACQPCLPACLQAVPAMPASHAYPPYLPAMPALHACPPWSCRWPWQVMARAWQLTRVLCTAPPSPLTPSPLPPCSACVCCLATSGAGCWCRKVCSVGGSGVGGAGRCGWGW